MGDSYFFKQPTIDDDWFDGFSRAVEEYSHAHRCQVYLVKSPLSDDKYSYDFDKGLVLLSPGYNMMVINFGGDSDDFDTYHEEFEEDLASISDKFRYKDYIGRPKSWRKFLVKIRNMPDDISQLFAINKIENHSEKRVVELLISLLTGSINNIENVKSEVPGTILDKVKKKIILFDGEQTRFIYQKPPMEKVVIQGLSGTGKTELLMHKLKEVYTAEVSSRVLFTCHNKILAASLRKRIPEFFNFMKVEQQILWHERLWCIHAWGSTHDKNSGAYRYICDFYKISFSTFGRSSSFKQVCQDALDQISEIPSDDFEYAFDYVFIDESQDFPEPFIELCVKVTKGIVYVAGDIFQSIFSNNIVTKVEPTYLLSKCYRTDAKTLMFSHALGMGLFEMKKIRWLKDEEWSRCGYEFIKNDDGSYSFTREPLRRFEDLENLNSVRLIPTSGASFTEVALEKILETINGIRAEHATVSPDDIAVIFIDNNDDAYYMADKLEELSRRAFGWAVNKAYSSKAKIPGQLFVSNTNNVKGLEFPFVICITRTIHGKRDYRNALYTMMTRSFITSFLILSSETNKTLLPLIEEGLRSVNQDGCLRVFPPRAGDHVDDMSIGNAEDNLSLMDVARKVFDELDVMPIFQPQLISTLKAIFKDNFDEELVRNTIRFNYDMLEKQSK